MTYTKIDRQKALNLLKDGMSPKEVSSELNCSYVAIQKLAQEKGLTGLWREKQRKQNEALNEEYKRYKALGHTVKETAEHFGVSISLAQQTCKGIAPQVLRAKGNQYTSGSFDRTANAKKILERFNADWEYISGYVTSDSTVLLKHKVCGHQSMHSLVTARHSHLVCAECLKQKREEVKRERKAQALIKRAEKQRQSYLRKLDRARQLSFRFCECCGDVLLGSNQKRCKACQEAIAKRKQNVKKQKRVTAALTSESVRINAKKLFERDKGVCWICGGLCDINADANSNYYPSVDHIIPISKGGKDTLKNVRLAHRICNSLRGNADADTFPRVENL